MAASSDWENVGLGRLIVNRDAIAVQTSATLVLVT